MNKGKVCVSVCAETVDEFIEKIKRAREIADVVELRFDWLNRDEFNYEDVKTTENTHHEILSAGFDYELIQTFRPKKYGGMREISENEQDRFWNGGFDVSWADVEKDRVEDVMHWLYSPIICSHHDFDKTPDSLLEIFKELLNTGADIVKIAVKADEITDSLSLWKLLLKTVKIEQELAAKKPKRVHGWYMRLLNYLAGGDAIRDEYERKHFQYCVPIAMGEAGKWTRILGLAHGAPITYASLEEGDETAPGQISAKDLIEVYRVKELDEETEIYGIIGNPVSHSLSPYMHNAAFKHHNLNAVYIPFEVSNLDEFIKRMVRPETREIDWNLKGFSVTIPHKEAIIEHLDFVDENAKETGAVNTVKIIEGKLHGYNTDAEGFIDPLRDSFGDLKDANVGIIGSGGAARACIYALKKEGTNVTIFNRNPEKAKTLAIDFGVKVNDISTLDTGLRTLDCIVNASPLGTTDDLENETPATSDQLKTLHLVYDLVYNPIKTLFLREAESAGVPTISGIEMLISKV